MRNTHATRTVLETFEHPGDQRYGFDIIRRTGYKSGTVYPILHRLEADGYLSSGWENINPVVAGRPPRRWYQLTAKAPSWWEDAEVNAS